MRSMIDYLYGLGLISAGIALAACSSTVPTSVSPAGPADPFSNSQAPATEFVVDPPRGNARPMPVDLQPPCMSTEVGPCVDCESKPEFPKGAPGFANLSLKNYYFRLTCFFEKDLKIMMTVFDGIKLLFWLY